MNIARDNGNALPLLTRQYDILFASDALFLPPLPLTSPADSAAIVARVPRGKCILPLAPISASRITLLLILFVARLRIIRRVAEAESR